MSRRLPQALHMSLSDLPTTINCMDIIRAAPGMSCLYPRPLTGSTVLAKLA